jgi:AcrR family transcriptional regulator
VTQPARQHEQRELLPERCTANGTLRRLLSTSIELFAHRGYHGVSVRDIATEMGVQPSSLYAHYRSKEELFSALVLMANEEIHQRLVDTLLTTGAEPPAQLAGLVRTYVAFHAEYPLLATIGHNDLHVLADEALHRVTRARRESSNLMRAVIERGVASGDFDCAQPWLAVAAIAGMGIRLATWYRSPDTDPRDDGDPYPADVRDWVPSFDVDTVAEEYAGYALAIAGWRG